MDWIARYWIEIGFSLVISAIGYLFAKVRLYFVKLDAVQDGIKAILHDRIIDKCKEHLAHGSISDDDLDELDYLNEPYKALGGNGTVKIMLSKVHHLKVK